MSVIVIWCRHKGDNVIGIHNRIPWSVPSDMKRFRHLTWGKTILAGRKTYETFPNRTLENRRILVLTSDSAYEVADREAHHVIARLEDVQDYAEDIYVVGGASVYEAFFKNTQVMPDIVVDSVYNGNINVSTQEKVIDVSASVKILEEKYFHLPSVFELDDVETSLWIKKGDFVDQNVIKMILNYLENERTLP